LLLPCERVGGEMMKSRVAKRIAGERQLVPLT
jgi:hypothetical protein